MGELENQNQRYRRMTKTELADRLDALQHSSNKVGSANARETEFQAVLHELEVYQIELEMQNRELRDSRQAVEESHDRYVNLYDFAPVGYVTLSDQGLIREINLTASGMLGVERHWLMGRSLAPWVAGTELPAFRSHLKKSLRDDEKVTTVLYLRRRDGHAIPVELSSTISSDPITGERLIRTAITDLSERRKAEEERDRFFELSTDLLCVLRTDGRFERLNPAWEKVLGYTREELLARPYVDFLHPDDRDPTIHEFEKVLRGAKLTPGFQNRFIKKDRSHVWLTWTGVLSGSTFYGVARDTTEETLVRKTIDSQYAWLGELVESLPIPLVLAETKTGKIISVSSETECAMEGYSIEELSDSPQNEFYFSDSTGNRLKMADWPRFRAARGSVLNGEELIWHSPRRTVPMLVWSRIIPAKYDRPEMVIVMLQDIHRLKQKEESLNEAVDNLTQERQLRETFVSRLTHDLRTPLTSARMSIQLLGRNRHDDAAWKKLTLRIINGLDRIDNMIHDLLDANRIHAGENLPIEISRFDLVRLVKSTAEILSTIHGPRIHVKAKGRITGTWSKNDLQRVVENLVNNAVKYGAANKPITVSVAQIDTNRVSISVHNFGNPIAEKDQGSLFDQFRRTHSAEVSGKKGWGVGLALVRGIANAHGGDVTVSSDSETGTTFMVVLLAG